MFNVSIYVGTYYLMLLNLLINFRNHFLQFYDGGSSANKLLGTYCNDTGLSQFVHSTKNQMYIKFRSSGFSKGRGFSLTYASGSYKLNNKDNICERCITK